MNWAKTKMIHSAGKQHKENSEKSEMWTGLDYILAKEWSFYPSVADVLKSMWSSIPLNFGQILFSILRIFLTTPQVTRNNEQSSVFIKPMDTSLGKRRNKGKESPFPFLFSATMQTLDSPTP